MNMTRIPKYYGECIPHKNSRVSCSSLMEAVSEGYGGYLSPGMQTEVKRLGGSIISMAKANGADNINAMPFFVGLKIISDGRVSNLINIRHKEAYQEITCVDNETNEWHKTVKNVLIAEPCPTDSNKRCAGCIETFSEFSEKYKTTKNYSSLEDLAAMMIEEYFNKR